MTTNPHADQPNDTRRADLEKNLNEFGKAYGKGQNSRPAAAQAALEASVAGVATPNDAKELWTLFQRACAKVKSIEYKEEGSFAVQVSKFKQFLVMGQLSVDTIDVMNRATEMIIELAMDEETRKGLKGSAYDNMVKIARAQIKAGEQELTDDEIRAELLPDAPVKDEAKILKGVAKTLSKLLEGDKEGNRFPSPQAEQAFKQVENRLAELGAIDTNSARPTALTPMQTAGVLGNAIAESPPIYGEAEEAEYEAPPVLSHAAPAIHDEPETLEHDQGGYTGITSTDYNEHIAADDEELQAALWQVW
jgi:hypothetical protein